MGPNITYKVVTAILISIVGFFLIQTYFRIIEVQKDVIQIRLDINSIEQTKITRLDVIEIVDYRIQKTLMEKGIK